MSERHFLQHLSDEQVMEAVQDAYLDVMREWEEERDD